MTRVRVHSFAVSLDGYAAGPDQAPTLRSAWAAQRLTAWFFDTASAAR